MTVPELRKLLERIVRDVWAKKALPGEVDKALVKFFASEYWKAIEQGYGQQLATVDLNTVDYSLLRKLEENVYQFSMAKSYSQLKAISQALIGEDGQLRTFTQFRIAAAQINNDFVNQWLLAEYNYAQAAGRSAAQWQTIQATKEVLPFLEYSTVGDDRVRPDHQDLEGIVRPVDDSFWDIYYPPNGWGCRCDVRQRDTGPATPLDQISLPDIKPLFMYNPGKTGFAFPPGHPYYDGLPQQLREQATGIWIENRVDRNGKPE